MVGPVTIPGVLPRLSRTPGHIGTLGPALGSANDEVYTQLLGIDAQRISALKESGVI